MNRTIAPHVTRPPAGVVRLLLPLLLLACLGPGRAEARPRPSKGTPFTANKSFGLGLVLIEPIGLCAKYYLSPTTALDFAFGEYDRFQNDDDLGVHADFLWHPLVIVTAEPFLVPLYFGVGGRVTDDDDDGGDEDVSIGVRGPIGVALDFNRIPLDIFFELAIIIEIVNDEADDDVELDPAIGVRYFF